MEIGWCVLYLFRNFNSSNWNYDAINIPNSNTLELHQIDWNALWRDILQITLVEWYLECIIIRIRITIHITLSANIRTFSILIDIVDWNLATTTTTYNICDDWQFRSQSHLPRRSIQIIGHFPLYLEWAESFACHQWAYWVIFPMNTSASALNINMSNRVIWLQISTNFNLDSNHKNALQKSADSNTTGANGMRVCWEMLGKFRTPQHCYYIVNQEKSENDWCLEIHHIGLPYSLCVRLAQTNYFDKI